MTTIEEIKKATTTLSREERMELFQWLENSEDLRLLRYQQLKRDITAGIEEADRGETDLLDIEAIKAAVRQRVNPSKQR